MGTRTFTTTGIVLKRLNTGETDRIVTLLTQEHGKIACVAKGVRTLHSSRSATLEPGNLVTIHCVQTKSMPILTQAKLLADTHEARTSLKKMRQLHQFLEIIDRLFVEDEIEPAFFKQITATRSLVVSSQATVGAIRTAFTTILAELGYHDPSLPLYSILEKVSEVTERPIRSFEYLVVKPD